MTGFASERIDERLDELSERHGLRIETVFNPKALEWNNAYSLWCAREHFGRGVLLANGDTVHPASVEQRAAGRAGHRRPRARARPAQGARRGGDEGPRQRRRAAGPHQQGAGPRRARRASTSASTLIEPHASEPLAAALEATFERDPQLYYEDGFQELADRGGRVATAPIGAVEWVEVDDHRDLARAREVACRC